MNDWLNQPDTLNYPQVIFRQLDRLGIIAAQGKMEEFFVGVEILEKILKPREDEKYTNFLNNWNEKYRKSAEEYRRRRVSEGTRALEDFKGVKIELALEKLAALMELMDRVTILPPRGVGGIIDAADYAPEEGVAEEI